MESICPHSTTPRPQPRLPNRRGRARRSGGGRPPPSDNHDGGVRWRVSTMLRRRRRPPRTCSSCSTTPASSRAGGAACRSRATRLPPSTPTSACRASVSLSRDGERVIVSFALADIVFDWRLERLAQGGTRIAVHGRGARRLRAQAGRPEGCDRHVASPARRRRGGGPLAHGVAREALELDAPTSRRGGSISAAAGSRSRTDRAATSAATQSRAASSKRASR